MKEKLEQKEQKKDLESELTSLIKKYETLSNKIQKEEFVIGNFQKYKSKLHDIYFKMSSEVEELKQDLKKKSITEVKAEPPIVYKDDYVERGGAFIYCSDVSNPIYTSSELLTKYILEKTPIKKFVRDFNDQKTRTEKSDNYFFEEDTYQALSRKYQDEFKKVGLELQYFAQRKSMTVLLDVESLEEYEEKFGHMFKKKIVDEKLYKSLEPTELFEKVESIQKEIQSLEKIISRDRELSTIKKFLKIDEEQIKKYLGIKDLYNDEYKDCQYTDLIYSDYRDDEKGLFVKIIDKTDVIGDYVTPIPKDSKFLNSSEDAKVWVLAHSSRQSSRCETVHYQGYEIYKNGKLIIRKGLDTPYFVYEDFEGGKTHHNDWAKISKIESVKEESNALKITYLDRHNKKHTDSIKR